MRLRATMLAWTVLVAGCQTTEWTSRRSDGLHEILAPSVQLRTERAGARGAGSGVVVASDASVRRSWVITTRHLVDPPPQQIWVTSIDGSGRLGAFVYSTSADSDLALVQVEGRALPPATLQDNARLGDEVRVVAFPWGRRLTGRGRQCAPGIAAGRDLAEEAQGPRFVGAYMSHRRPRWAGSW